jgi:hypothetical protein
MYVSYHLSEIAGTGKASIIGYMNEVTDMIFGEGFNICDIMANIYGIQEQQNGTSQQDAEMRFNASAPMIDNYNIKVKYIPFINCICINGY